MKKRRNLFDIFKDEDLPPCKWCGRVMLVGWCCTKALEEAKKCLPKPSKQKKKN